MLALLADPLFAAVLALDDGRIGFRVLVINTCPIHMREARLHVEESICCQPDQQQPEPNGVIDDLLTCV